MTDAPSLSTDALTTLADTLLAVGLQYGLWVEKSPNVEEQIALSSMSQDKLGHARAFLQLVHEAGGPDPVALQYDRAVDDFRWTLAWTAPLPSWNHLVVAQVVFGRALLADVRAFADGTKPAELLAKIEQEESWHTRHGDAWLSRVKGDTGALRKAAQAALDELWPYAVAAFGATGVERFPDDVASGARTADDDALRAGLLAEVVPLLEEAGLKVPASQRGGAWTTDPAPDAALVEELRARTEESRLELVGMLQDPVAREMSRL